MNITISKDALEQAISAPAKLARAAKVDYLSCILLDARGDGLDAAATDMNESVRCFAMAMVEEEGCALVPALALSGVVKTLPDKAVTLRDGGRGVIVECGKTAFDLPALDPGNFPGFPDVEGDSLVLDFAALAAMVSACKPFAAKKDEARKVFTCARIASDGTMLTMECTDSFRVGRAWMDIDGSPFECCAPVAFLDGVLSVKCGGNVVLTASAGQIKAKTDAGVWTTRTVEGKFPNVKQLFDGERIASAAFDLVYLRSAVKRAQAIGKGYVRMQIGPECLLSRNDETGAYEEELEAIDYDGGCHVGVQAQYLADALGAAPADEVRIELISPLKPIYVTADGFQACIMPVRMDR